MTAGRIARLVLFAAAAVGAAFMLIDRVGLGVETDLYGLLGTKHGGLLRALATSRAGSARILLESRDADALAAETARLRARLKLPPPVRLDETTRALADYVDGLLAPNTRARLLRGEFRTVADEACARLYGPVPPVFSVKRDPFLLATEYALALGNGPVAGWTLEDGCPSREGPEGTIRLLEAELSRHAPADLAAFLDEMEARPPSDPVKVWCAGAPFHAARAARRARTEVGVLSWISLAGVLLLGWRLFGAWRFVPGLLAAVGFGGLLAAGALFAVYPRPHVLTFVFGTSLIGLSVDYVYHAGRAEGTRGLAKPLGSALVTTVACLLPLFFASVTVLGQMALFTGIGLVAVYAWVMAFGMPVSVRPVGASSPCAFGRYLVWGVALVALLGLPRLRLSTDPAVFYRPDPYLLAGERKSLEMLPAERFCFVRGPSLQESLEREEAAGLTGLSTKIPSLRRQRENVLLKARLQAAEGARYAAVTGVKMPSAETPPKLLDPETCPVPAIRRLVAAVRVPDGLLAPCPRDDALTPDIVPLDPKADLADIFRRITAETARRLAAGAVLFLALAVLCVRRARLRCVSTVALALACTAGTLGWWGVPVTFFTLLCFFVLAGLGIDYAIFSLAVPAPGTRRIVRFSFLTSLIGFGLLAFTAFPVTRDMGRVLGVGLLFAYLLAGAWPASPSDESATAPWYRQRECGAGRLRLAFLWGVYVLLGKRILKACVVPIVACLYPWAGAARRALRAYYAALGAAPPSHARLFRHLLGFAWALVDKTDVATRRRSLPCVMPRIDADWEAFQADLAAGRGAFLLASHLGTAEMLSALPDTLGGTAPHLHAFQQLNHDAVFTRLFLRHFDTTRFTLHAVEDIGVETAAAMQEAIRRGELVLMAGDRVSAGSAKTLAHPFFGRPCRWPKGVFVFARLMEAPVYFVTCVRVGRERWEAHLARFEPAATPFALADLLAAYVRFLEGETRTYPEQWHHFHDFFA